MSYSETINEKTGDVVRSEYKVMEKKAERKEVRSKDETYTAREKKKVDYEKKAEVKKKEREKDCDRKAQDQEKKDNRSRDRKSDEKKYEEKNLVVNKKPDSKQKTQEAKHKERRTGEGHKEKQNDAKPKNENANRRSERKNDEKKNAHSEDAKRNDKGQMQVGCVAKAFESINVNPVALLVSKMIDQQSLVVKLLTEAREKEARKLELMDRGEKCDEILRMKEKVRILEKQLRSLEMTLDQKVDKFDRFDSITKTESTQTQQYGIDNATNTGVHTEPIEAKDVGIRITNAARQRHTCTIF